MRENFISQIRIGGYDSADNINAVLHRFLRLRSDRDNFYYRYVRRLSEKGVILREKTWNETIPRDFP